MTSADAMAAGRELQRLHAELASRSAAAPAVAPFQQRVQPWMMECFGPMIAGDREERNHRFLEEALELVQATGCSASEAHQLVDYVFGRPVGEPAQEAGGVMVTLAALCLANGLDMHTAAETELARIWTKVEAIRAKQAAKPKHSPLPAAAPRAPQAGAESYPPMPASVREALEFYAKGDHFTRHDPSAWDTVSGEPQNLYEDESNTATVEDGSFAKKALADLDTAALRARGAVPSDARIRECAARLVEHADFRLGGVLSAESKTREIPSRAVSQVKARHLAALRDALAAAPQPPAALPGEQDAPITGPRLKTSAA
jgi:hypothetical protein